MSSLESISFNLVSKALELTNLLRENGFASPSFGERSARDFEDLSGKVSEDVELQIRQNRNALIDGANDLILLAKGPTDALLGLAWSVRIFCFPESR